MAANPANTLQQGLRTLFNRLWLLLIEPGNRIQNPDERGQVRLLSALTLPFIPAVLAMTQWQWLSESFRQFLALSAIALVFAYFLARFGRYQVGAIITTVVMSILPIHFLLSLEVFSVHSITLTLSWNAPALFVAYLFFGLRGVVITVAANLVGIGALPYLISDIDQSTIAYILFFHLVVTCEILIAALVRHQQVKTANQQSLALKESEERYRDLFNATVEGIIVHEKGIVLDANPAFEEITGYTLSDLIGSQVALLFPEDERAAALAAQASTKTYQARGMRKDGTIYWFEARGQFHMYRGRTVRVASIQDVTERRQAEARQLELAIERQKVTVLQHFIGDMSHDLRTPLSVMKTSIYLLEKVVNDPVRFKQSLETLDAQTDQLQHIIEDLISMSRLDKADTSDYRFAWCDINKLIEEALGEQQTTALRKRIQLHFIPADGLPTILVDSSEFKKMIRHLVINGINFTPEKGTVTVRSAEAGRQLVIEISDTGVGIPALDLPLIFDRFYRADHARGTEGGTGLGLSIARKIAEAHGGSIEAESELNQGSTFRVRLPKPIAASQPASDPTQRR